MPHDKLSRDLAALVADLPEEISRDDLLNHEWLRRLVLAADDLTGRVWRDELHDLKSAGRGFEVSK
jgi:hypothetical protein